MEKKQSLILNILTFDHCVEPVTLSFYREPKPGFKPLRLYELPVEYTEIAAKPPDKNDPVLYTGFEKSEHADIDLAVDLSKSSRFAVHYYRHLLSRYIEEKGIIHQTNFIKDAEVWIENDPLCNRRLTAFDVFGLRVQMMRLSKYPELVVYYKGLSRIIRTGLASFEGNIQSEITRVLYQGTIMSYRNLPEAARYNLHEVYPVVNKALEKDYGSLPVNPVENTYTKMLGKIEGFINTALATKELKSLFPFHTGKMIQVPEDRIFHTRQGSNKIQLGLKEKVDVFTPKFNLKSFGPYRLPEKQVRFIVIFFEKDRKFANELFMIMKGLRYDTSGKTCKDENGAGLYDFVRLTFDFDKENSLVLNGQDEPLGQIHTLLDNIHIDTITFQYVAIYLSPYPKNDEDEGHLKLYYRIKELLLLHHISSQVIYKEKIMESNFRKYYLLNIASALLAKAGGLPWRLDCSVENELVVGIGAFKSEKVGVRYVGSAFSFNNDGEFREFDCVSQSETRFLAQKIKIIVQDYIKKNENISRLIIHFYKNMGKKDLTPLAEMLFDLGFPELPIIVLNINKTASNDYIAFDTSSPDLMPISGTILHIAYNEYLLFNNTRYSEQNTGKIESWHLPLKIKFQSTHPEVLEDVKVIKTLLDQVYQFSRMYYKSVKQQNLPVTLSYPEMVAKIFPWFEGETLCDFGKRNMWFL